MSEASRSALRVCSLLLVALVLVTPAARAAAQRADASHFVYTGPLQVGDRVVAQANEAPLSRVRFGADEHVEITVRGAGFTLAAEGTRARLTFHVHVWTAASARGFRVLVPPEARLDVLAGSREDAVVSSDAHLGEITLSGAASLPPWVSSRLAADTTTRCEATRLHAAPREAEDPLEVPEGLALHTRPARDGFDEAWVMLGGRWIRGYARDIRCQTEDAGEVSFGLAGSSYSSDPPHVLLPAGLVLVSPSQPERPVLRVTRAVDAIDWGPGWSAASEEGAIQLELACGLGDLTGRVTFTPTQLVPRGAPPLE
jgi:hypothetical protein